jgi:hypothetical protein
LYIDYLPKDTAMLNQQDFLTLNQLDLDNKLILPTQKLLNQVNLQLNRLYQDIRSALIDAHSSVATTAKQVYEQPGETLDAWYEQTLLPLYREGQISLSTGTEQAKQYLYAFWDNPRQVTEASVEPLTLYMLDVADQSAQYWLAFTVNPELFISTAFAPITEYLSTLNDAAEVVLVNGYYSVVELFSLLMAQPSITLQAMYHNTLSALLEIYFDTISSLLISA